MIRLLAVESFLRVDPAFDSLIPAGTNIEKLAGGFAFTEGPLWRSNGSLWFSDVIGNVVRQWSPDGTITEILRPGGYDGNSLPEGGFNGPNGMTADRDGAVVLCQHGNRRIVRISRDGDVSTVVDRYEGKRLNSPNDLVFHPDGSLYFTDPPYGLPRQDEDASKELAWNGVYRLAEGKLQLIIEDLHRPNGLAFSPDYKVLYVANSERPMQWMQYDVASDGTVRNGRVFADVDDSTEPGVPDGLKIDVQGNLYAAGPGGVWVYSSEGAYLGTIKTPETSANCAWGDDGRSLYITAITGLYRVRLAVPGMPTVYPG
jgi:gluconolactonase